METAVPKRTFDVCKVEKATTPLKAATAEDSFSQFSACFTISPHARFSKQCGNLVNAGYCPANRRYDDSTPAHALIQAVHKAFADHYPLELTPDCIWITLVQGLSR